MPLLLLIWQLSVSSGLVTSRLLPSLVLVWGALVSDISNGVLPYHAGVTVARALAGFVLAAIAGVLLGAAMARSSLFGRVFEPFFFLGYPVPKIALFPVFTFVFGIGSPSKIAFTFLECLYPIVVTTSAFAASRPGCCGPRRTWVPTAFSILHSVIMPAAMCRASSRACALRCRSRSSWWW